MTGKTCSKSDQLFSEAKKVLPGGVNSPVRAFGSVGMKPKFIAGAEGATITDVDGNTYIDYVNSWGPMILGHNHPDIKRAVVDAVERGLSFGAPCPVEVDVARLMCAMVPNLEMVRMVNSGTEAVMSALRLARGATGKDKIIKFEGCYHGHVDSMLVKAGSGVMTAGIPNSGGITKSAAGDTLLAVYNDLESVERLLKEYGDDIAGIILEPVGANMGVVPPTKNFLQGLRDLCDRYHCLLIFDEVITGFRLAPGGAQEYFGVRADLLTFGKIIGAGMPVGAYGGSRQLMENIAPCGSVYQAGTLSGNPVAMAAGYTQLSILKSNPKIYTQINAMGEMLANGLAESGNDKITVQHVGSLVCAFFTQGVVKNYEDASQSDTEAYGAYFRKMIAEGVYLAPAQFEAMFVSAAHSEEEIQKTISAASRAL